MQNQRPDTRPITGWLLSPAYFTGDGRKETNLLHPNHHLHRNPNQAKEIDL
jgi:hypothetical protein